MNSPNCSILGASNGSISIASISCFLPRIAARFQEYLGCPEFFEDIHPDKRERHRYVSPTRAKWDGATQRNMLEVCDQSFGEIDFREGGFFYFGLRVFLEHGPAVFPKEAFWFLSRGKFDGSRFLVTEQKSLREFDVGFRPLNLDLLCDYLFELLKNDLGKNPMVSELDRPNKVGVFLTQVKFTESRPFADPDAAARKIIELANAFQPVQDGRIYIEKINGPFLFDLKGTPTEYKAGLDLAIAKSCTRAALT